MTEGVNPKGWGAVHSLVSVLLSHSQIEITSCHTQGVKIGSNVAWNILKTIKFTPGCQSQGLRSIALFSQCFITYSDYITFRNSQACIHPSLALKPVFGYPYVIHRDRGRRSGPVAWSGCVMIQLWIHFTLWYMDCRTNTFPNLNHFLSHPGRENWQ